MCSGHLILIVQVYRHNCNAVTFVTWIIQAFMAQVFIQTPTPLTVWFSL